MQVPQFKSVIKFLDFFKEEKVCRAYLERKRWNGKPTCPHCHAENPYTTNRGYKCSNKECYRKFTVTIGTIFENSNIKLRYWFAAIQVATAHKKGISSYQLARDLGVTQKTAWFMLHRIREMMRREAPKLLGNMVEVDETFVGGKDKNRHIDKRTASHMPRGALLTRGTPTKWQDRKVAVVGILERGGKVAAKVIPNVQEKTLIPIVKEHVSTDATVMTDEHVGYSKLTSHGYTHETIRHSADEYVRGLVHTNSIEGFWSLFKRGIIGIYHFTSEKHLQKYVDEFAYRYNTRKITDSERFSFTLTQCIGRLTYANLITA